MYFILFEQMNLIQFNSINFDSAQLNSIRFDEHKK
jgi:hypothetical protein